jgi:PAS domain S-box-containing protein
VPEALKILLLEDSIEDAELIEEEMRMTGLTFTAEHVFLKAAFIDALDSFQPTLILVDAKLPGFDGHDAIRFIRTRDSTMPVIAVTGELDDDDAVNLLRAGANDYVLKDRLARLGPAISRALEERTERVQRAAAEERYQRLFAAAKDGIVVAHATTGVILDANPAICKMIRGQAPTIVGREFWHVPAFGGLCKSFAMYRELLESAMLATKDGVLLPAGARPIDVEIAGSTFENGDVPVFQCNIRDVSERNRLRRGLLEATDREKHRLAQEIHDGLGQELVGLDMLTHSFVRDVRRGRVPNLAELERMPAITQHALAACHAIAQGLSPLSSTGGGLLEALHALRARLTGPPGPILELHIDHTSEISLSAEACSHLYRIAQEAVSNAMKHAAANVVRIQFKVRTDSLQLVVSDDGRGLAPTGHRRHGLGMQTMRDRAASIGATLYVTSDAASGTTVTCQVLQDGQRETV